MTTDQIQAGAGDVDRAPPTWSSHGVPSPPGPAGRDRLRGAHAVLFALSVALWYAVGISLSLVIMRAGTDDVYLSERARDAAVTRATIFAMAASSAFAVATIGLIARRVGYRLRDGLFALVPFYSLYFVPKILWRWTALPTRYWATGELGGVEVDDLPPSAKRQRAALLGGVLVAIALAAMLGVYVAERGDGGSAPNGWTTTSARGMSISLPSDFYVFTDPGEFSEGMAEVGLSETDELAEMVELFPDFFALAAFEPLPDEEANAGAGLVILRIPSANEPLEDSVELFNQGVEQDEFSEVTAESETTVGTGRHAAFRIDAESNLPGFPREWSVTYIVDGGSQVWVMTFSAPHDDYESLSPTFDRSIASLTLP